MSDVLEWRGLEWVRSVRGWVCGHMVIAIGLESHHDGESRHVARLFADRSWGIEISQLFLAAGKPSRSKQEALDSLSEHLDAMDRVMSWRPERMRPTTDGPEPGEEQGD
jgi:hypothetical protein